MRFFSSASSSITLRAERILLIVLPEYPLLKKTVSEFFNHRFIDGSKFDITKCRD
jgi:hypothetical protein